MLNKYTLRFDDDELQDRYDQYYAGNFKVKYTTLVLVTQLFVVLQVIYAVQTEATMQLIFCIVYIIANVVTVVSLVKGLKSIHTIQMITSILLLFVLYKDNRWVSALSYASFQIALMYLGTNILLCSLQWTISLLLPMTFMDLSVLDRLQCSLVLVTGILVRYQLERQRRESFLQVLQNEKWGVVLIERTLPSWVVILKYDHVQRQITVDKINKNLQLEMEVENERKLRSLIRRLFVFPADSVQSNLRPVSKNDRIDFEQELIKLLKSSQVEKSKEVQFFYGFQALQNRTRIYKITVAHFYQLQPLVLLLFEEITENKYDDLSNAIFWRELYLEALSRKTLNSAGSCIAYMKTVEELVHRQVKTKNQAFHSIMREMNQQIQKMYVTFNTNLNTLTLAHIESRCLKFKIDRIDLSQLLDSLRKDLTLKVHVKQPKVRVAKSFLKRTGSRQVNVPDNQIYNDKQKLIQIIISLVEFINYLNQVRNNQSKDVPIQISISTAKKQVGAYVVRLSHPHLAIPDSIVKIFNNHWAGSVHNQERWGSAQNFKTIQEVSHALSETLVKEVESSPRPFPPNKDQICNKLIISGVPLALYLISQVGPLNVFFFKRKELPEQMSIPLSSRRSFTTNMEDLYRERHFGKVENIVSFGPDNTQHPDSAVHKRTNATQTSIIRRVLRSQNLPHTLIQTQGFLFDRLGPVRERSIPDSGLQANQIKFFIYKDLKEVIDEINKVEMSQGFMEEPMY